MFSYLLRSAVHIVYICVFLLLRKGLVQTAIVFFPHHVSCVDVCMLPISLVFFQLLREAPSELQARPPSGCFAFEKNIETQPFRLRLPRPTLLIFVIFRRLCRRENLEHALRRSLPRPTLPVFCL